MEYLSWERLLLLLAFVLLPILKWLFGQVFKRPVLQRRLEQAFEPPQPRPIPVEKSAASGRNPTALTAPPVVAIRRTRAAPIRALVRRKHELRRAVILMTVLGPCRDKESDG
jgi:hypothetical protein